MANDRTLCVMLDVSRDGVMKVEEVKRYAGIIKKMGYNALGLYMEDVYEIADEPYFGHLRGRYSKKELKDINDYCKSIGITAIPYIQTLAHLEGIFKWAEYQNVRDIANILLVGEEKTYELIEKMFKTLRDCFDTEKINIGMDEAPMMGRGVYLDKHGYPDSVQNLLYEHLVKVGAIADKYGFKPTMWSDLIMHMARDGKEVKVPENVTLCYWDYYRDSKKEYDQNLKKHLAVTDKVAFAGGAWAWTGFAPMNKFSYRTMKYAMQCCRERDIKDVTITVWGDDGRECSCFAVLPALFYCAEKYRYQTKDSNIKAKFAELFGIKFDGFASLDLPNEIKDCDGCNNPSRWGLYNDPFCGRFDYHIEIGDGEQYKSNALKLKRAAKSAGEFAYLFDCLSDLCKVLELKYDLGVKTRAAYLAKNKKKLNEIANVVYPETIKRLKKFIVSFKALWNKENKPFGLELHEMRLGGLLLRLESCRETLVSYLGGQIGNVEELEAPVLKFIPDREKTANLCCQSHINTVTVANMNI